MIINNMTKLVDDPRDATPFIPLPFPVVELNLANIVEKEIVQNQNTEGFNVLRNQFELLGDDKK